MGKRKNLQEVLSYSLLIFVISNSLGENPKIPELSPSRGPPEGEESLVSI